MDLLKAAYSDDWDTYDHDRIMEAQSGALEPLELSKMEEHIIIARMKKIVRDPAIKIANALELVHLSYQEQDWERQETVGDIVRPTPADRKAWAQYEQMITTAVQLLAKYRGVKGDWRTDRFDTIPTNQRSSMASMAAARVKESIQVEWETTKSLGILAETFTPASKMYRIPGVCENATIGNVADRIAKEVDERFGYVVAEGISNDTSMTLFVYDHRANIVDTVQLSSLKS